QGLDVDLVIVGRPAWLMEEFVSRLRSHPELGKRLFWFESADDRVLQELYASSTALLLASEGEGFGLPLVEAAQHRLPIITRDLPVFREVAGEHAFYFNGASGKALADAIWNWLALYAEGRAPASDGIRWIGWDESTRQLLASVEQQQWYARLFVSETATAPPGQPALLTPS
ncbi:glycosyltransferase, partial [Noviherbaspirillum sp.]|uniref:glycosyltransferase n=1 Tax=Noviherbaspirillum sp. TaxID=1926288 RepID=UPI002FE007C7